MGNGPYEEMYLGAYSDGWKAEMNLSQFLSRYCHVRPHCALGKRFHIPPTLRLEPFLPQGVND